MTRPLRFPDNADRRALSFLRRGAFELRRNGWRFGTARIPEVVVERLIATGKAQRAGDRIELAEARR